MEEISGRRGRGGRGDEIGRGGKYEASKKGREVGQKKEKENSNV